MKKTNGPDKYSAFLSLRNQKIMEDAGLNPMPVFHRGEPEEYLRYYVENYGYIGIGLGGAKGGRDRLRYWLERIFSKYILDEQGRAKVKLHGFGVGSHQLIFEFPWYSVDSSSTTQLAAYGQIVVPQKRDGDWSYTEPPHIVKVKEVKNMPDHAYIKKLVLEYAEEIDEDAASLANSWAERLRWNTIVWQEIRKGLPSYILVDGEEFRTRIYSVCSSTGHLEVFRNIDPPPRILVSHYYLRDNKSLTEQCIEYKNQYG